MKISLDFQFIQDSSDNGFMEKSWRNLAGKLIFENLDIIVKIIPSEKFYLKKYGHLIV